MMFNNITIKSRLVIVIGVLSVLLVGIGGLGLYGIHQSNSGLQTVYDDRAVPLMDIATINDKWQVSRMDAVVAANSGDTAVAKARAANAALLYEEIRQIWSVYMTTYLTPEEARLAENYSKQVTAYVESRDRTFQLAMAGDFEGAIQNARADAAEKFATLHETIFSLIKLQGDVAGQEYAEAQICMKIFYCFQWRQ